MKISAYYTLANKNIPAASGHWMLCPEPSSPPAQEKKTPVCRPAYRFGSRPLAAALGMSAKQPASG